MVSNIEKDVSVHYTLQYDRPSSPFSEFAVRTRFFPAEDELWEEVEHLELDPDIRILKAFKQTTIITRELLVANRTTAR